MTNKKAPTVMMMAAGTGGHIFPALAVANALKLEGATVHWLATPQGMENKLVPQHHIALHAIDIQGIRGNGIVRLLKAPFKIMGATLSAMKIFKALNVDIVVGFGGYVTGPGGFAAKLMGIPIVIHEQNALAGMTNRYLAKISTKVLQAFPDVFPASNKIITTGNPIREDITLLAPPHERYQQHQGVLNILVVGGSLGAQALNKTIPQALALLHEPLNVIHQCGQSQLETAKQNYQEANPVLVNYQVVPFIDNMAEAYAKADLVICRAGALTVSEIATVGVPAVFIPLPTAVDDHQTKNAEFLATVGAGVICPQKTMTAESLAQQLKPLLNRDTLAQMASTAYSKGQPDATETVKKIVLQLVK